MPYGRWEKVKSRCPPWETRTHTKHPLQPTPSRWPEREKADTDLGWEELTTPRADSSLLSWNFWEKEEAERCPPPWTPCSASPGLCSRGRSHASYPDGTEPHTAQSLSCSGGSSTWLTFRIQPNRNRDKVTAIQQAFGATSLPALADIGQLYFKTSASPRSRSHAFRLTWRESSLGEGLVTQGYV